MKNLILLLVLLGTSFSSTMMAQKFQEYRQPRKLRCISQGEIIAPGFIVEGQKLKVIKELGIAERKQSGLGFEICKWDNEHGMWWYYVKEFLLRLF